MFAGLGFRDGTISALQDLERFCKGVLQSVCLMVGGRDSGFRDHTCRVWG